MMNYLLRIEGVNLGVVLDDTAHISVIRGGSLLLRRVILELRDKYFNTDNAAAISTGASIGLFEFKANTPKVAEEKQKEIIQFLNSNPKYSHFTFVVDIWPQAESRQKNSFHQEQETLLALNRFRQLQQLSLALPQQNQLDFEPCELEGRRPGDETITVQENDQTVTKSVSDSVKQRHEFGRKQKQAFYRDEVGLNNDPDKSIKSLEFSRDLHELAGDPDRTYGVLTDKMALIYLDGNKFTKLRQQYCETPEKLRQFDLAVQTLRRQFLHGWLLRIQNDAGFLTKDKRLRVETLLWGGDELLLLVPAWRGFETLQYFYECSANWRLPETLTGSVKPAEAALTHGGGLLFCHVKTPIYRARQIAKSLGDAAKEWMKKQQQSDSRIKPENRYNCMALESIDFPTEDLNVFWSRIYGDFWMTQYQPLLPCSTTLQESVRWLKQHVSKGQVYALNQATLMGRVQASMEQYKLEPPEPINGADEDSAQLKNLYELMQEYKETPTNDATQEENKGQTELYKVIEPFLIHRQRMQAVLAPDVFNQAEQHLEQLFPKVGPVWRWLHLCQLWDYLAPEAKQTASV